ncbi:nucleoside/nucleotide kinase family protein [Parafrigoribacterium soli]|uniref:nucleoside/nucleotide kinase family protein n=1 Tax=Parafrigoribacterium soli TaxID=3144663 RepID=UPI0032EE1F9F
MNELTSLGAIARLIKEAGSTKRRVLVGIVGPPAAGKSTIAEKLVQLLGPTSAVLGMDGFHLPQRTLVKLGKRDRMGAPDTFDVDGFVSLLITLSGNTGATVLAPGFDREIEEPIPEAIRLGPELKTIVVEGNYLLHDSGGWERVAPLLDLSFFVRIEHDIRMARLVERHIRYGKTPDAALAWATGPDADNARLIGATAERADYIIDIAQ